jgi:hypothetical protein
VFNAKSSGLKVFLFSNVDPFFCLKYHHLSIYHMQLHFGLLFMLLQNK